ncbi:MAG: glucuronate isomerase [Treponema sp.]|nr:glucuronate isomerase [Treponema sp.]
MTKPFIDDNFLLETETARNLFNTSKDEPIYDYHCHLSPELIAQNKQFDDLGEIWLGADHYKWRMMRAMGFDEYFITGSAPSYEKFLVWAKTVENLIGNPLYHWTHLELQRYFGIYEPLTEKSAPSIWEKANTLLKKSELSIKGIFEKFNVYAVGTTDDPCDSLEHHRSINEGTAPIGKISTKVIPSFRPDKVLNINVQGQGGFKDYINILSITSGIKIKSIDDVLLALEKRLDFFIENECRSSDHALEYVPFCLTSDRKIDKTFKNAMNCKEITKEEIDAYKTKILCGLAKLYSDRGIVMQLHLGALRNVNNRMFKSIGPDTGYDYVSDQLMSVNLAALLNKIESFGTKSSLPKTVLYTLNPKDYYPLVTIMGGFQENDIKGKIQLGTAWWFCDNKDGMEEQIRVLANNGVLPAFVGMLTDSRSFLSYPRHEYFRRILCNLIGKWVENGEYPQDQEKLEKIVKDISFGNAKNYFN